MKGTLHQLRILVSVAECGSFTAAAAAHNVEVSVVSRAIRDLEFELGVPLFERLARGVQLTLAGHSLVNSAREILERVAKARLDARRAATGCDGHLALGFVYAATSRPLVEMLKRFASGHPGIGVDVTEGGDDELIGRLRSGRLDVAITATDPPPHERLKDVSPLRSLPLWMEPLVVLAPASAPAESASWEDLAGQKLLCRTLDDWPRFVRHVLRVGGPTLSFETHTVSQEGVLGLVAAGLGWAILPDSLGHVLPSEVKRIPISSPGAELQVEALWCGENKNPALTHFLALCGQLYGPDQARPDVLS